MSLNISLRLTDAQARCLRQLLEGVLLSKPDNKVEALMCERVVRQLGAAGVAQRTRKKEF